MARSTQENQQVDHMNVSVPTVLALASFLIFINMFLFNSFLEGKHVRECHSEALNTAELVSEEVSAVEYYEFAYRTCMREHGEVI